MYLKWKMNTSDLTFWYIGLTNPFCKRPDRNVKWLTEEYVGAIHGERTALTFAQAKTFINIESAENPALRIAGTYIIVNDRLEPIDLDTPRQQLIDFQPT